MSKLAISRALVVISLVACLMACGLSSARADVFTNVPEAAGYSLVYQVALPNSNISGSVPYSINNAGSIAAGSFTRIGYYLELDTGSGLQWVYASFDAAPFQTNASLLGVPISATGEFYHYDAAGQLPGQVRNMNVASNVGGIVTGTGITTGNVEFWPSNYGQNNDWSVPGASSANNNSGFDFGDGGANTGVGHGSMQIHNYGAAQTLFAIDGFNQTLQMGIGNQVGGSGAPDWTFQGNAAGYTVKNLQVVVGMASSVAWNGGGGGAGPKDGAGTWNAVNANWWDTGATTWSDGRTAVFGAGAGNGAAGTVTIAGTVKPQSMTFNATGDGNPYTLTGGTIDLNGSIQMITANASATINSPLTNGGIMVLGSGTLTLSGTSSYTGSTLVTGGNLNVSGGGALSGTGSLIIQSGGSLSIANGTVTMGSSAAGVFGAGYGAAGTGTVTVGSGGVLNIGAGGGRTFIGGGPSGGTMGTGILTLNAGGTVNVAAPGASPNDALYLAGYGGTGTIYFNGGVLATARGISTGGTASIVLQSGGGTIDDLGSSITINSSVPISGNGVLIKKGAGTLTLGSSTAMVNSFGGTLEIDAGTLKIAGGDNNANHFTGNPNIVVNNGGTLAFNAYNTFGLNTASMSAVTVNAGGTMLSSGNGANHVTVLNNLTLNSGTATINCNDGYGGSWGSFGFGGTTTATGSSAITLAAGSTGTIQNGNGNAGFGLFTVYTPAASDSLTIAPTIASGLALTKTGSGTLTLTGANTYSGNTIVSGGKLVLAPASGSNTLSNVYAANASADRGTVVLAGNSTMNRLYVGSVGAGAVIQSSGTVVVGSGVGSTDVTSLGYNGGYGYYQMNDGTLTTGQLAAGSGAGSNNVGVFDQYGGSVTVNGSGGWLLAGGWTANSKGSFNLYGGTLAGPAAQPVTLNVFNNANSYAMFNLLGSGAVLDATANGNGLNLLNGGTNNTSAVVNLNAGRIIASRVYQGAAGNPGSVQFNFNGGTLQAKAGGATVTMALTTGGSAIVYAGGANIDSADSTFTISQPLLAPAGYGATGVAVNDGGAGYIGAPFVLLTGGSGVGATAIAQVNLATGKLTNILVTSPGSGYGASDVLTATLYGGGATTPATIGAVTLGANTGGGLTKTGTGTLTLSGANTYTGGTTLNEGTLNAANNAALGTGTLTLNAGTLGLNGQTLANNISSPTGTTSRVVFTGNSGGTLSGSLTGAGTVNFSSTATAQITPTLPNTSAFTGTIGIDTSPIGNIFFPIASSGANAKWVVNGGGTGTGSGSGSFLFTTSTNVSLGELSGNGRVGSGNNITTTWSIGALNTDSTFSGTILNNYFGGTAAVQKVGTGTLTLTGNNTYSGGTTVSQGTLEVCNLTTTAINPLGTGAVTLAGGTLKLSGQVVVSAPLQPVSVSGWNQDLVTGASETAPGYSVIMGGWNFYEAGLAGGTQGLPADSGATPRTLTSVTNSNLSFQFAPYVGNNAVYLDGPGSATLTLNAPGQFQSLAFLETTRSMSWNATLNFADGSTTTTSTWTDPDWTNNPGPADRALTSYGLKNASGGFYSSYLWMAGRQIVLSPADQAKALNSITFHTTGGSGYQLAMFAVSGASGTSSFTPAQTYGNAVNVTGDATVDVRNSLAATMGPLSIGAHTLLITGDSGASVTFGATTLTGNATFNTAANTSLTLGPVGDGGAGLGLTKAGAGTMTLNGHSTYGGATVISGGTLRLSGATSDLGNLMPLGDSITYGSSGTNAGYRSTLYNLLTAGGYTFKYVGSQNNNPGTLPTSPIDQTYHEGHPGWTIEQVLNGVTPAAQGGLGWLAVNPDVITMMIGTNNRSAGVAGVPTDIAHLGQIIDTFSQYAAGATLFVAEITPIPDASDPPFVAAYNASLISLVNAKLAAGAKVALVDLYTNFPANGISGDNLHPNDIGYAWMAQQWYNAIVANLGIAGDNGLPAGTALSLASGATLDLNGVNQTIASLADQGGGGGGRIINDSQTPVTLTLNPATGLTTFSGSIDGAISLVKNGAGTQVLRGDSTYDGGTTINAGRLLVSNMTGSGTGSGPVIVNSGGTLGGYGYIDGPVTVNGTGIVAPGASVGRLTLNGAYTMAGGTLDIELAGLAGAGMTGGNDVLAVMGLVNLSGGKLDVLLNCNPGEGNQFLILDNLGEGLIASTFAGLPEGSWLAAPFGGRDYRFQISYVGGTGNDVVLTSEVPEPATMTLLLIGSCAAAIRTRRRLKKA